MDLCLGPSFSDEVGGAARAQRGKKFFPGNIFASLKLIHMLKLKSNLGTYGIWHYQMGALYLKHAVPPGLAVLSMTEQAY